MRETGGKIRTGGGQLLASLSALLIFQAAPNTADGSEGTAPGVVIAQAETSYTFEIEAQPLPQALVEFSSLTGLQVLYTEAAAFNFTTAPLVGTFTASEALRLLLAGSGLEARFTSADSVTLELLPTQGSEDGPTRLSPIVIEGGKIAREFIDTPASVGVVTGEDIETYGVDDLRDAFNRLGNVRWFEGNRGNAGVAIRGLSSEGVTEPTNNNPLTSIIIDGATQTVESTRRGARGVWDIGQVEVFRGPQSTLQGRNSLAGSVILRTNDPTFFWEGQAQGILAQDDRRDGAFVLSGPLIPDALAFRVSGEARRRDLEINYNVKENRELAEDRYRNIRGKLLLEPEGIPELSVLVTASRTFDKPGVRAVNGDDFKDREFLAAATTAVEQREATNNNYILEASYEFTDSILLRSISAIVDSDLEISTPSGFFFQREENRRGKDFTQDLRLEVGDTEDTLSGVIGVFYGDFTLPRESLVTAGGTTFQRVDSDNKFENKSIYADLRYRFLPDWSLLAGGRYTNELVTNKSEGEFLFSDFSIDAQEEFHVFLPKAGLVYDITDNQSIAVTAQQGYRSGFTSDVGGELNRVDPEFLWSYELAYRAQSDEGRWDFGATGFYYDYKDQQIAVVENAGTPAFTSSVVNAGGSFAFGAELQGRYGFDFGMDIYGSLGLLKTEFDDLKLSDDEVDDLSGNEFPEAPAVTASFGASYRHHSGFFAAGDFNFTDSFFSIGSIRNDEQVKVDSFWEVNLRAGYEMEFGSIAFFVDNVFDKDYITSLSNNNPVISTPPTEATIGDGRKFGVELTLRF